MKILFLLFSIGILISSSAQADEARINEWLKGDKDNDGALSKSETSGLMTRAFDRVDANKDGKLDREELTRLAQLVSGMQKGGSTAKSNDKVEVRKDQVYREGHERWKLDVYLPKGDSPEGGRPGIVFVHGGGWKTGSKDGGMWSMLPMSYAEKGYVCISVNYRLIGNGKGITQCVHDVKNSVRWFRANSEELGLDPDRIGAFGISAGGHLVSMLGLVKKEHELEGDGTHLDQSSMVQSVCAVVAPSNFLSWGGRSFSNQGALGTDASSFQERARIISPVTYAAKDAPPFFLIYAKDDRLVPFDQCEAFDKALKKAEAKDVKLMTFEDGGHGVFGTKRAETYPAVEAFFERTLKTD